MRRRMKEGGKEKGEEKEISLCSRPVGLNVYCVCGLSPKQSALNNA